MKGSIVVVSLALAALPGPAEAAFEDLGAGARAPGMGGVFAAVADDVYSIYYNPAGLGVLERPALGTSYTKLYPGLSDDSNLSTSFLGYAHPLREGRDGTVAAAWNSFSLNGSLYREQTVYLSYGRLMHGGEGGGELFGGASLKYLHSGVGSLSEASDAYSGIGRTGQADPVLSSNKSKGAFDADAGLLYRFSKHYSAGLQLAHLPQPNVASNPADSDRLPIALKAGLNYRSLISNVGVQVDSRRSPTGSRDSIFSAGAERWFPKLFAGDIGARAGLGYGSRDYAQVSVGASYRTRRVQVDYAFAIPVSGVESTAGSHRVAFSLRFGRATDEEETLEMLLEAMRRLKAGQTVTYQATTSGLTQGQRAELEEYLAQAKRLELTARYQEAGKKVSAAMGLAPADKDLAAKYTRLNFTAQYIPVLPDYLKDPLQARLHQGLLAYLSGNDAPAVQTVSEALSLRPEYRELDLFLAELERVTGLKRSPAALQARTLPYLAAAKLTQANTAIQEGRYQEAIELSLDVLHEDEANAEAWENLGTAYFAVRDYASSLKAWNKALEHEKDPSLRESIRDYIKAIERSRQRHLKAPQARPLPEKPRLSSQEVQKLYNEGVDHYTRRQFDKARDAFQKILEADPQNVEARKALKRVMDALQ